MWLPAGSPGPAAGRAVSAERPTPLSWVRACYSTTGALPRGSVRPPQRGRLSMKMLQCLCIKARMVLSKAPRTETVMGGQTEGQELVRWTDRQMGKANRGTCPSADSLGGQTSVYWTLPRLDIFIVKGTRKPNLGKSIEDLLLGAGVLPAPQVPRRPLLLLSPAATPSRLPRPLG